MQCISTNSACLSCLPSPYVTQNIYFSFNNTCVSQCPDTYFLNSTDKSCGKCSSTCLNCNSSANSCTSCPTGKYLLNNTCLSVCPNGYYSLSSECLQCSSPCATCSGQASSCLSCINGYFLDYGTNSSKCVTTCSNSNYLGIDGQCKQCTNNCKTCSVTLINCTSCDETNYQFYQNSCVRNCPVGMYTSAVGICSNCVSPCLTCSTQLNCQSCVSGYYFYNGTSCVSQCPNGFLGVVSDCVTCDSKCATCSVTVTNCTSCPSGSYYYQNDCYTTCPALTYPYNKTCTRCITPCVTCSSSPQLCLSCIDGLLLLNNTCVSSCPLSGYIQQQSTCLSCPQNCLTCSTSINCTLCNNDYYLLQGACTSSCPANYPIVSNRQCEQCSDVCLTCDTSSDNCTSCKIGYFRYLYTCVSVCPLGYYSNVMTSSCEDGLSTKIVFFPLLIISVIILAFVIVAKLLTLQTSFPSALVSLLSLTQLSIWIFMLVELAQPIKQLNVDYALPIAMNVIALVVLIAQNVGFFYLELKRMQQDDYVKGWGTNNVNYTVLTIHRYVGLIINFKFFRFCYSRFFNIRSLSLPFKKNENIFPLTTVFSILNFVLCQVPMLICGFSLVYKKILKDQIFYTSIQCLIITVGCAVILFIDIFKSEDYFEESDYVKTRKYLEKIKDASFNQLQDNFDISKDQGSIDAEKFISKTGGKFIFSKQDPSSIKQLFFQQEVGSAMTDAFQTIQTKNQGKSQSSPRKSDKRINIFDPIKQQDEEIYENVKYSESQIKTQAQIENERQQEMTKHRQQDDAIQYEEQKNKRLMMQFGINTDQINWDDDTKSMIQQRPLKQKWNNIIGHRQRLARSIFNTMDEYSTKELEKIIEPIQQDDYEEDERQQIKEDPFRFTEYGAKVKKTKRRKRKIPNQQPGNNELQKIYLQRLTQKKNHKNIYSSSQSVKYDF